MAHYRHQLDWSVVLESNVNTESPEERYPAKGHLPQGEHLREVGLQLRWKSSGTQPRWGPCVRPSIYIKYYILTWMNN